MSEKQEKDPLQELEEIFTNIAEGHPRPIMGLSGIEPATDPMAELEEMGDEESAAAVDALRSSLVQMTNEVTAQRNRADKLDRDLDQVVEMTVSARLNIRSALAIIHLQQHDPMALSSNAVPGVFEALTNAAADLEKAEIKADRIPF